VLIDTLYFILCLGLAISACEVLPCTVRGTVQIFAVLVNVIVQHVFKCLYY